MIDFRIKGTKLPVIPVGTCVRLTSACVCIPDGALIRPQHWYSFGYREFQLETYILAESKEHKGTDYYMIRESDIIRLAKEQGMIKDEFVLPDEWYVIVTEENKKTLSQWRFGNNTTDILEIGYVVGMYHWSDNNFSKEHNPTPNGWKNKITFDQFKKYILKQDTMEKEIIGYKLKDDCEKYKQAALSICNTVANWENSQMLYDIKVSQTGYISKLAVAGVLDLWFEPVYKQEYPNITINGYKGEFFNDYVKFGYAKIDKDLFIDLENLDGGIGNKSIESITIGKRTFTNTQIKEIAEYYNAKISK